jgi:transcriptional regulator with GAF, ATPase, and Fis domain
VNIDEMAVVRRMAGDRTVTLNTDERRELIRRLHAAGFNDAAIHHRTGLHPRTVLRHRQRLGLTHNWFPTFTYQQPPRKATT